MSVTEWRNQRTATTIIPDTAAPNFNTQQFLLMRLYQIDMVGYDRVSIGNPSRLPDTTFEGASLA